MPAESRIASSSPSAGESYTFMRVPPAAGPRRVECIQMKIQVSLSRSRRITACSPSQRSSSSSNVGMTAIRSHQGYDDGMCRNIHTLFNYEPPATEEEVRDAALQYVRKISGFTKPSRANEEAFARAVDEVADASRRLLEGLVTTAAPKDREVEAERARARAAKRFATA
jgi:hypothetical protein